MCGIIGIVGTTEVASALYDGLTVLQHRGQDAAGIATVEGARLRLHKGNGLVRDVFNQTAMNGLRGRIGLGHCRYPTAGSEGSSEAQPFYVNSPYGIAFAHNGNLVNTEALRREMFQDDRRHINTDSDSEVLLNVLAHELQIQDRMTLTPDHIFKAVAGLHVRARACTPATALKMWSGVSSIRSWICSSCASTFSSTSESESVLMWRRSSWNISRRSASVLTRLPLCANAMPYGELT